MKFFKLIRTEIKNLFRSKFLLICGILVLLSSIAIPVITALTTPDPTSNNGGGPIVYAESVKYRDYKGMEPGYGGDPITIDGQTIQPDNPFYYNLLNLPQEKDSLESQTGTFTHVETVDVLIDIIDLEIAYYLRFATSITTQMDYRVDLGGNGTQTMYDKFIYEHSDMDPAVLLEAVQYRMGMDETAFNDKYVNITAAERQTALDTAASYLDQLFNVVENNDFPGYINLRIQQEQTNIANVEAQIAIQEQTIIEHPDQEDSINQYINDMRKQIELIETNTIPILQYRLEKNIIPIEDIWQNSALSDIENYRNQLQYTTILPEEDFSKDQYLPQQYKTYAKYKAAIQAQIDGFNNNILIAQQSLDADQPDMKFVTNGARVRTVNFLNYSIFVALFGVLIGGWLMANEFQSGTIRLLMIRPKTRTKILASKFLAALIVCLGLYVVGSLLNMITNGICFGFSDLAYPNYTVSGEVNFFMYYIPKLFACMVSIVFLYCVAFMLSVVVRNVAVSIAVPIVSYVGCFIAMTAMAYLSSSAWLAYTPIPYVQLSSFFISYSSTDMMIQNGVPLNLTYGILLLLGLSAVCAFVSVWVFKKRDITN